MAATAKVEKRTVAVYHLGTLSTSGADRTVRGLVRCLANEGCDVHVICREERSQRLSEVDGAFSWSARAGALQLWARNEQRTITTPKKVGRNVVGTTTTKAGRLFVHVLPRGYLPDYSGDTASQHDLQDFHNLHVRIVSSVCRQYAVDVLHTTELLCGGLVAAEAADTASIPFVVSPEAALADAATASPRWKLLATQTLLACAGLLPTTSSATTRLGTLQTGPGAWNIPSFTMFPPVDTRRFLPPSGTGDIAIRRGEVLVAARAPLGLRMGDSISGVSSAMASPMMQRELSLSQSRSSLLRETLNNIASSTAATPRLTESSPRLTPSSPQRVITCLGALSHDSLVHALILAFPLVLARCPAAHVLVAGVGPAREVLGALVDALAEGDAELLDVLVANGRRAASLAPAPRLYDDSDADSDGSDAELRQIPPPLVPPTMRAGSTGDGGGGAVEDRSWGEASAFLANPKQRESVMKCPQIRDRVHFVGELTDEALSQVLQFSDVGLFAGTCGEGDRFAEVVASGAFPLVPESAQSWGNVQSIFSLLGRDISSRLVFSARTTDAVSSIASALIALLTDEGLRSELPMRLHVLATEHHDDAVRARQLLTAYAKMAPLRPREGKGSPGAVK